MSYILDALAKSERERRLGAVPTLSTPPLPEARARRRITERTSLLVLAAAVGAVVLIGLEVLPERSQTAATMAAAAPEPGDEPAAPVAPASASTTETTRAAPTDRTRDEGRSRAPRRPPESSPTVAAAPATTVSAPPETARSAIADGRLPRAAAPVTERRQRVPEEPAQDAFAPAQPRSLSAASAQFEQDMLALHEQLEGTEETVVPALDDQVGALDAPRVEEVLFEPVPEIAPVAMSEPPAAESAPRPEVVVEAAPAPAGAPQSGAFDGLPSGLAARIGPLAINVHIYSEEPSERMVLINMKRYREGERLREGPRLDAITPAGAMLSYESTRFLLAAR